MAKIKKWKPDGTNTAYPVTNSKAVVYVEESDATTTTLVNSKIKQTDAQIANGYDETSTYSEGSVVRYNGALYRCARDITTAETWTSSHWIAIGQLAPTTVDSAKKAEQLWYGVSRDFETTIPYAKGAIVNYKNKLYICNTEGTQGNWDVGKWDEVAVKHCLNQNGDGITIDKSTSGLFSVKDEGITIGKLENDIQTLLSLLGNLIEVKETGFYFVDANMNVGFAVENPECFGLGLANE